jgi:hypothetical protein
MNLYSRSWKARGRLFFLLKSRSKNWQKCPASAAARLQKYGRSWTLKPGAPFDTPKYNPQDG